jgi:hypothetical protein
MAARKPASESFVLSVDVTEAGSPFEFAGIVRARNHSGVVVLRGFGVLVSIPDHAGIG